MKLLKLDVKKATLSNPVSESYISMITLFAYLVSKWFINFFFIYLHFYHSKHSFIFIVKEYICMAVWILKKPNICRDKGLYIIGLSLCKTVKAYLNCVPRKSIAVILDLYFF